MSGDDNRAFLTRVAWLYHVDGLTQSEVAKELGETRLRINQALRQARQDGIVRIEISSPFAAAHALQETLTTTFGLRSAFVGVGASAPGNPHDAVAAAASFFLNQEAPGREVLRLLDCPGARRWTGPPTGWRRRKDLTSRSSRFWAACQRVRPSTHSVSPPTSPGFSERSIFSSRPRFTRILPRNGEIHSRFPPFAQPAQACLPSRCHASQRRRSFGSVSPHSGWPSG